MIKKLVLPPVIYCRTAYKTKNRPGSPYHRAVKIPGGGYAPLCRVSCGDLVLTLDDKMPKGWHLCQRCAGIMKGENITKRRRRILKNVYEIRRSQLCTE